MQDFLVAIGLLLVLEGLLYGGFPTAAKRMAADMIKLPESILRIAGLASIALGVWLVWMMRG